MQKKTRIAIGAAAVAGLAVAVGAANFAFAERGMGGWGGWGGWMRHHGGAMGGPMGGRIEGLAERYDANKDGKVTQEEIDQNRSSWFAEFDADKNSGLSLDEFKNLWLKARNLEMVREFQRLDRDGNGTVTPDEYERPLANVVAEWDANGDKALSEDDRRAIMDRMHRFVPGMDGQGANTPPPGGTGQ